MHSRLMVLIFVTAALGWACSPSNPPVDGDGDSDGDSDGDVDGDSDADGDADGDGDSDGDSDSAVCPANGDLVIEASEARPVLGASLTYLVNGSGVSATVDLEGEVVDGVRTWRFDAEHAEDRRVEITVHDPAAHWFGAEFPDATYGELVPGFEVVVGLYRVSDQGIELLGLASLADESSLVHYDPPVFVMRFPGELGRSWTEESHATGRVMHIAFNADETWQLEIDATGEVITPAGPYPVARVRSQMDRAAGPLSDQRISYAFVAECWGRIAYVGSLAGERELSFTEAEQLWRLTLR